MPAIVLCGLLAAACGGGGSGDPGDQAESGESAKPHGYVEGAEEASEPQSRLVLADADGGKVGVLDLLSGDVTELDGGAAASGAITDGRFAYLPSGDRTRVIDSGVWTVDHGDHKHYYRAKIAETGAIDGTVTGAWSDTKTTALARDDGTTVLLDREKLEDGEVAETGTVDGIAVPYEQHVVVAGSDGIVVRDRDGKDVADLDATCTDPRDAAVTTRGVVVGCADGAVLVDEDDDTFSGEQVAYPGSGPSESLGTFGQRPGSSVLAAAAGEDEVWVLDAGEGSWHRIETQAPVAAVAAVGEDVPVLVLTDDGVLHAYDPESGDQQASQELVDGDVRDGATIAVDTNRAYVNDVAAQQVHEVDYNDELRVARTLDVDVAPAHLTETGR